MVIAVYKISFYVFKKSSLNIEVTNRERRKLWK